MQAEIGYPIVIRPSFTLGGTGGGIAYNREEFEAIVTRGLDASPTSEVLLEESVIGWKEFEMEVVRDRKDNCIIVCSIENLDPMGVHTGDSITVAPAQTLTDKEYQRMRDASIAVLRKIGVETGGSNVQFAVNPKDGRLLVIEMNPRVSRSSALASKATGFPIAKIAAKLAVGYTLDELRNDITGGATPASFEPAIDYVVTKIPRFTFEKFPGANDRLTTQMKSVGEVMAIGRTFQESLQKALRGLETGCDGLTPILDAAARSGRAQLRLADELRHPGADRLRYVADAFRAGWSLDEIAARPRHRSRGSWRRSRTSCARRRRVRDARASPRSTCERLLALKRKGFSDRRLARAHGRAGDHGARAPARGSACARSTSASTPAPPSSRPPPPTCTRPTRRSARRSRPTGDKIMILGGGPNRIGQGIEFDYCCVHAALALREDGFETIMVNCNPETVSTDYDTSDRLYFEPLTLEDVLEIIAREKPKGVIVQFGGQTPLKLARALEAAGAPIIGTTPDSIDVAEDRERFQQLLTQARPAPAARTRPRATRSARSSSPASRLPAGRAPVLRAGRPRDGGRLRPRRTCARTCARPCSVSNESPVLLDRFLDDAIEVDVDAVCDGEDVLIGGIMEHIEQAGVHSGDSGCSLPPTTPVGRDPGRAARADAQARQGARTSSA